MGHNRKWWVSLNWGNKWKHGERDNLMAPWKWKSKACTLAQFSSLPFNPPNNSDLWHVKCYSKGKSAPVCLGLCLRLCVSGTVESRHIDLIHSAELQHPLSSHCFAFFFYETEAITSPSAHLDTRASLSQKEEEMRKRTLKTKDLKHEEETRSF